MKVFDILKEFRALEELLNEVDAETGEFINNEDDIKEYVVNLRLSKEDKLNSMQDLKLEFNASVEAIKAKIEALNNRKKSFERNIDNLINLQLMLLNGQKLETNEYSFSFRKSESVNIDDFVFNLNDTNYTRTVTKIEPDKTAIKKALKDLKAGDTYQDKKGNILSIIAIIDDKINYVIENESSGILEQTKDKFLKDNTFLSTSLVIQGASLESKLNLQVK